MTEQRVAQLVKFYSLLRFLWLLWSLDEWRSHHTTLTIKHDHPSHITRRVTGRKGFIQYPGGIYYFENCLGADLTFDTTVSKAMHTSKGGNTPFQLSNIKGSELDRLSVIYFSLNFLFFLNNFTVSSILLCRVSFFFALWTQYA